MPSFDQIVQIVNLLAALCIIVISIVVVYGGIILIKLQQAFDIHLKYEEQRYNEVNRRLTHHSRQIDELFQKNRHVHG